MLRIERSLQARGFARIAGLDEAGRGPLAGPVTAAAVILPQGRNFDGLTDSKMLSPAKREHWYQRICQEAVAYQITQISEQEIDEINILQASRKAMAQAAAGLAVQPDYLLIDGISPLEAAIPQQCIKKGDRKSLSIAAASVLAKVTRDRIMEAHHQKYPAYNFKKNKGYGTREHREAIKTHGPCPLHRQTFRGVKDAEE